MKPKITLCMIVKDETHIIEQCLRSIAKYVDRYDITDTGSTDGTQELIKKTMDELGIPGEVYQSDWKGFGDHAGKMGSRTEAFRNAEKSDAEYAWVIDADDYVEGDFRFPDKMTADAYSLKIGRGDFTWWRNQLFKLSSKWTYKGVLHEYALSEVPKENLVFSRIDGPYRVVARTEGARNVGITPKEKYERDAELLEKALEEEPNNERYMFYLAQSYFDSHQWDKSLAAYERRAEAGGWQEEVYYAKLRCAIIKGIMEKPREEIAQAFLDSYNHKPDRAEPLWFLSRMYRMQGQPAIAYLYARMAADIPYPSNDILFIQDDVYRWGVLDEIGATAAYAGKHQVGYQACKTLLDRNLVPDEHKERIIANLNSYTSILGQKAEQEQIQKLQKIEIERQEKKLKKRQKVQNKKKSTRIPEKVGYKKRPK